MTYSSQAKKRGLRRVATLLAALGMLVMSSGVALMVTSTSANAAADKVGICHATSSDSNPYVFIVVDVNSAKLQGHLMHRNDPNKRWKTDGYFSGVHHVAGQLKPDLIGSFTDIHGVFHLYDGNITASSCENHPLLATASVSFVDPTCANQNAVSYSTSGTHDTFSILSGSVAAGQAIVIRATADGGAAFAGGATTLDFPHTFGDALNLEGPPCVIVGPPNTVTPIAPTFTEPTCTTGPSVTLPSAPPVTRAAAGPELATVNVDGVHYVETGYLTPGGTVDVDATAIPPNVFADGVTTHWEHTFITPTGCTSVSPPVVKPPVVKPPSNAVTPTLVHAGLISVATPDLNGQRGLALMVAGLLLLVAGGGLGLVRPGGQSRS